MPIDDLGVLLMLIFMIILYSLFISAILLIPKQQNEFVNVTLVIMHVYFWLVLIGFLTWIIILLYDFIQRYRDKRRQQHQVEGQELQGQEKGQQVNINTIF